MYLVSGLVRGTRETSWGRWVVLLYHHLQKSPGFNTTAQTACLCHFYRIGIIPLSCHFCVGIFARERCEKQSDERQLASYCLVLVLKEHACVQAMKKMDRERSSPVCQRCVLLLFCLSNTRMYVSMMLYTWNPIPIGCVRAYTHHPLLYTDSL